MQKNKIPISKWGIVVVFLGFAVILLQYNYLSQCNARLNLALKVSQDDLSELSEIETDALSRWSSKIGVTRRRALEGRRIFSSSKDNETCVVIALHPGSLGTNPIYCYDDANMLVDEYSELD